MEDLLYESDPVRRFVGLKLSGPLPDEITILNFRHLLERHLLFNVNYFCRSCCLIEKCYRDFSTWGPLQPALIPALQGVPPWAHRQRRRPAFWP